MRLRALLTALFLATCLPSVPALAAARSGKVSGIVVAQGTPQLGATVIVTPEDRPGQPLRLVTNRRGVFSSVALLPGAYSVRAHVAGFLPAFESRVVVVAGEVTLLRIELGSLFSSVDRLRRGPLGKSPPGQWNWVLRSASLTRPVLRFANGRVTIGNEPKHHAGVSYGRAELTAGSLSSWSPANPESLGSTSFFYDHGFSPTSQFLVAGRVGYRHATSTAFAATWVQSAGAQAGVTNSTTVIFHESQMTPDGPSFHGVEIDSRRQMDLSSRIEIDYGGQFLLATFNGTATVARPEVKLRVQMAPAWTASLLLGSSPWFQDTAGSPHALDHFATPVERNGRLALDRPWHEELRIEHPVPHLGTLAVAVFHDSNAHTAIFGRGSLADSNTIVDPYSNAFVYDGGALTQWGARLGYTKKLSSHWQAALVYAWSRTLAPVPADLARASLASRIEGEGRNSLGGRISGRIRRTGTEVSAGYQWIDGPTLTSPDPFGAALYDIDPYLNVSVRQPLPNLFCGRIVAIVDVRNLLAQGYVSLNTGSGTAVVIPAARSVRGGFAVQF